MLQSFVQIVEQWVVVRTQNASEIGQNSFADVHQVQLVRRILNVQQVSDNVLIYGSMIS